MVNQTAQNDENNRGKNEKEALLDALRPIWQGWQFWNRILNEEFKKIDAEELRNLLNEDRL
jgi:hypothetical protein